MKGSVVCTVLALLTASSLALAAQDIDCGSAMDKVRRGAIALDVRTKAEFDAGHLDKALNIPYDVIDRHLDKLPKDRELVLYCRSGRRSGIAKETLQKLGYGNVINAGGYSELNGCK